MARKPMTPIWAFEGLTEQQVAALERIFGATIGHGDGRDLTDGEAWDSMTKDADAIAREIGAPPKKVRAFLRGKE